MILQWYQNKIFTWYEQILNKNKEIRLNLNHNRVSVSSPVNSVFYLNEKHIWYPQDETNSTHYKLMRKKGFDEKSDNLLKQRYVRLIKNILRQSKSSTQTELIQKLNQIIGNWDIFTINIITRKKSIKLNLILYQLLWGWGLARHRKQRAKWIKNRYLLQRNDGLFFSVL